MYADLKHRIGSCHACQAWGKRPTAKYQLTRIPPPPIFGHMIGMDFVDGLPGKYNHMFSLVDYLTSWSESWPCVKADAPFVKKCLEEWRHRYGVPHVIVTDNAQTFRGTILTKYALEMGIELRHGSSNYAKTNGKVERYQGVVMKLVLKGLTASNDPSVKWHLHLPKAVWSWRIQPKGEMGVSPYLMVYGQEPRWVNEVAGAEVEELS
jgi:transposase InsO family protein